MAAIPASEIVNVTPGVLAAGGTGLVLSGLLLTNNTQAPVGTVLDFGDAADVSTYFGPASAEAALALKYFVGYDSSFVKPGSLLIAQYASTAVPAYLRGGSLAALSLAQLKTLSGTVIVTVDGQTFTSGTINLSGATSFSNAASLIQTGLAAYDAVGTASIAGTTMTVTVLTSGTFRVGQVISGANVTAGTKITALGTGTGGTGTYTVDVSQTAASTTISGGPLLVTFDPISSAFVLTGGSPGATGSVGYATGTISTGLALTSATGAVVSNGADAATPSAFMTTLTEQTQNFASFATVFKPTTDDMVAFAAWNSLQNNRFLYALWDDNAAAAAGDAPTSAGARIKAAGSSGTAPIYDPTNQGLAVELMGYVASVDFATTNARVTMAFRAQGGTVPTVTSASAASNLAANGYNWYGAYATANDQFNFLYPGTVSGPFTWIDTYINQIWLNNACQLALMVLLTNSPSIPYNAQGRGLIEAALADPIAAGVNFGAIRAGVTLTAGQIAQVNAAAGADIAGTLTQRGWYLSVKPASAEVRAARGSPPCQLFYCDGGSVQSINLSSVVVL